MHKLLLYIAKLIKASTLTYKSKLRRVSHSMSALPDQCTEMDRCLFDINGYIVLRGALSAEHVRPNRDSLIRKEVIDINNTAKGA